MSGLPGGGLRQLVDPGVAVSPASRRSSVSIGVPCRLHPRNGTALRRTSVTAAASRSRPHRLVGAAEHVEELRLADQRERAAGRLGVRDVLLGRAEAATAAPRGRSRARAQPGQQRRLAEGAERTQLGAPARSARAGRRTGSARYDPLQEQRDAQVLRQRVSVSSGCSSGAASIRSASAPRPPSAPAGPRGGGPEPGDGSPTCTRQQVPSPEPVDGSSGHGMSTSPPSCSARPAREAACSRHASVVAAHAEGLGGDLDAGALAPCHELREGQVGHRRRREAGSPWLGRARRRRRS